jgi:hypothetical protein
MVHSPPRPSPWAAPNRVARITLLAVLTSLGCGKEERPELLEPFEPPPPTACESGTPPVDYFSADFLDMAEYWRCPPPRPGAGGMSFIEASGTRATVTGGVARFDLDWSGEGDLSGREIVLWVGTLARGFYTFPALNNDDPQHWELRVNPEVTSGDYDLFMAISDGRDELYQPIIGGTYTTALHVIQVGTGDIQVNLNWDTQADLDLWVIEPGGGAVFWDNRTSDTGGRLDLDSYADCKIEDDTGRGNENVYWPLDTAPSGRYSVQIELYDPCDTLDASQDTHYHVTVVADDEASSFEGTFAPSTERPRQTAATFTY